MCRSEMSGELPESIVTTSVVLDFVSRQLVRFTTQLDCGKDLPNTAGIGFLLWFLSTAPANRSVEGGSLMKPVCFTLALAMRLMAASI